MRLLEQYYERLFGSDLAADQFNQVAACVDITAAATEFFAGNDQNYWDVRQHFGSLAGPALGWYEYAMPTHVRTVGGLQRLRPPTMTADQARIGYRVTRSTLSARQQSTLWREDPLPQLLSEIVGQAPPLLAEIQAARQPDLRKWQQAGARVQTIMFCEIVAVHPLGRTLSQLFGLYLDQHVKPLPELMAFVMPETMAARLGANVHDAQTQLSPLFYALAALNNDTAYLQPAADAPTRPSALAGLRFDELCMRNPRMPAASRN